MSRPPTGVPSTADVRELWRRASLAAVWLRPGDWYHPAVDALVEAVQAGRDPEAAASRLGGARALSGVGLREALDDLLCLFHALVLPPDQTALRALAVSWAEARESATAHSTVRDPATGLPTADYLGERLREVYGEAARSGSEAGETSCLVVLDIALDDVAA